VVKFLCFLLSDWQWTLSMLTDLLIQGHHMLHLF
jgi:hypothetical protein